VVKFIDHLEKINPKLCIELMRLSESTPAVSPAKLLQDTTDYHNEVVVLGSNPRTQEKVTVSGIFMKTHHGKIDCEEGVDPNGQKLIEKSLRAYAHNHNLPFVVLEE
jgi:hypothetical protein